MPSSWRISLIENPGTCMYSTVDVGRHKILVLVNLQRCGTHMARIGTVACKAVFIEIGAYL